MIHPKFWLKHAQAKRALKGYPLYDVPHKQAEGALSEKSAGEFRLFPGRAAGAAGVIPEMGCARISASR